MLHDRTYYACSKRLVARPFRSEWNRFWQGCFHRVYEGTVQLKVLV